MFRRSLDLFAVLALTCLAAVTVILNVSSVLRAMTALPLVLFLPGYAITTALFPGQKFGGPERLTFSLALSLCIAVLGGLVLNWMTWGLQPGSWAILLSNITFAATAIGLVRRFRYPLASPARISLRLPVGNLLLMAVAVALIIFAFDVAAQGVLAQQQETHFTQLWLLPGDGTGHDSIRLGIRNYESTTVLYRLVLKSKDATLHEWSSLQLNSGDEWDNTVQVGISEKPIVADLFRLDDPDHVYREVTLQHND